MLLQDFRQILSASLGSLGGTRWNSVEPSLETKKNSVELGGTLFGDEKKSRWNSVELGESW